MFLNDVTANDLGDGVMFFPVGRERIDAAFRYLPADFARFLPTGRSHRLAPTDTPSRRIRTVCFDTCRQIGEALDVAAVRYARHVAGLPELDEYPTVADGKYARIDM